MWIRRLSVLGVVVGTGLVAALAVPTASSAATPSKAVLAKINLTRSDLPAGWKGSKDIGGSGANFDDPAMARCLGVAQVSHKAVATRNSLDFGKGFAQFSSSASGYRTQSAVNADVKVVHNPKFAHCAGAELKKLAAEGLPGGMTIKSFSVHFARSWSGAPKNVQGVLAGHLAVTYQAQHLTLAIQSVFITGPRIEAELDAENVNAPVSANMVHSLAKLVAKRAGSA